MYSRPTKLAFLLLATVTSLASAGITVTSYSTVAQINGYAPVSQTQFFEQQTLNNITPATASVSGDWMGTNSTGSSLTWHFVGSAQASSTTALDASGLTISAAGSFSYQLDTSAGFVDPGGASIYRPGAAANYEGFFTTDVPLQYSITGQLNHLGRVRLSSFEWGVEFDRTNVGSTPTAVAISGTILPGRYDLLVTASLGAPNLPTGVNQYAASGSFENVIFTVQVPEPTAAGVLFTMSAFTQRRRKRSAGAIDLNCQPAC